MPKSRYGRLALQDCSPVTLFRAIDDTLRADPTLKAVIDQRSFRSWQGKPEDKSELAQAQAPAIRLSVSSSGQEQYWFPGNSKAWLVIQVEMLVPGTCADDVQNLFAAVRAALTPAAAAAREALLTKLRAAGAATGLLFFTWPQIALNDADAGLQAAVGLIRIEFKD